MIARFRRRSIQIAAVLLLTSMTYWVLLQHAPGGPCSGLKQLTGSKNPVSDAQVANMERLLGLHLPPRMQYLAWLAGDDWMGRLDPSWQGHRKGILRGDFGVSFKQDLSVAALLREQLPFSLALLAGSLLLAFVVALPLGIAAALRPYGRLDRGMHVAGAVGMALPDFWLGLLLILLLGNVAKALGLPFLPTGGVASVRIRPGSLEELLGAQPGSLLDTIIHLLLPALVLGLATTARACRRVRHRVRDAVDRAREPLHAPAADGRSEIDGGLGLPIWKLPPLAAMALIPAVGYEMPYLMGRLLFVEAVFSRPGIGRLLLQGILGFDYPVVMGVLLVMSLILALALPLRDRLDPAQELLLADGLVPGLRTGYGGR